MIQCIWVILIVMLCFFPQFNLPLHKDEHSAFLGDLWEDHSLFPMFWIEEFADLDETYKEKLNDMLFTPLKIVDGAQWTMVSYYLMGNDHRRESFPFMLNYNKK